MCIRDRPIPPVPNYKPFSLPVPHLPSSAKNSPKFPTEILCHRCGHQGITVVNYEIKKRTYGFMACLCCVYLPLCLLPMCVNDCKYAVHRCSQCGNEVLEVPPCE
eukprot:TRINITY_DN0_c4303_g1_i1.p1 TRINITY_DN0_c4303_g1~~TRINITY_DN0_c4303_g1_i1.p1  ORF type:complete len:105 (+),score=16.64 TRINITY_DN0_c4303_g1_i1:1-315(+)